MTTPQLSMRNSKKNLVKIFIFPLLVILILVVISLVFLKSELAHKRGTFVQGQAKLGQVLPDFEMQQFPGGKKIKFSELKAKVVLVNFWASWCEACIIEMPAFIQLRKNFLNKSFEIASINVDEKPQTVLPPLLKQLEIDFPVYMDPQGKLATLFDVYAIPLTVILNQERRVLFVESGERDWNSPDFHSILEKWL